MGSNANLKYTIMKTHKTENADPLTGIIRTLLVVFLAVSLQEASTNNLNWYWPIGIALVILVLSVVKPHSTQARSEKEIKHDTTEDIHSLPPLNTISTE